MAAQRFQEMFEVDYRELAPLDMLKAARNLIHQGHKLHTHPVTSGTVPDGNPFVSIVLSEEAAATDFDSVSIIEAALALYAKLGTSRELPEAVRNDFMLINCEMLAKGAW